MDNQPYQVQGQTQFHARGGMNPMNTRAMFNKVGYNMGGPNNMCGGYMGQRNMYMGQQGMGGK